jgi:hypothetical protein
VVIALEWHIGEENQSEFLELMQKRRRIRRRDGAQGWVLLRDLANPMLWVERYHASTWLDYIRLNNRLTREDAEVFERLRALNGGPPQVRRMIEREARASDHDPEPTAQDLTPPLTDPTRMP